MECIVCGLSLGKRRRKFCSRRCNRKDWKNKNKEKQLGYVKKAKKALLNKNNTYLRIAKSRPCIDCGVSYPYYVMEYDHLTNDKFSRVSALRNYAHNRLVSEIKKCELVCANCHRERTHQRRLADP